MSVEKITIVTDEKNLKRVEKVIDSIRQINQSLIVGKITYGQVGKDTLLSFDTDKQYYNFMKDKLHKNRIKVVSNVEPINEIKLSMEQRKASSITKWRSKGEKKNPEEQTPIEKTAEEGNYSQLIKIIKEIRSGQQNIDDAKNLLPKALKTAIEKAVADFNKYEHRQSDIIDLLLDISSNSFLQAPRYTHFRKKAAEAVVELVACRRSQLYVLINICNNTKIDYIGSVKSAVKFVEKTFAEPDVFDSDIEYAVQNLNLRHLLLAYPMVEHELSDEEIDSFNQLVDFIQSKKQLL